jgi:acyl transferase domain-containing protein/acyl carrier protein
MREDFGLTPSSTVSAPLAIIGIGCLFPGARGLREYWSHIVRGIDSITEVPPSHWRHEDYFHPDPKFPDHVYAYRGGFLGPVAFAPAEYGIAPNNLESTDTAQLLGLLVAREALEDAGYDVTDRGVGRALDRSRVSVILGVTGTLELVIPLGARLGHPLWRRALREAGVDDAIAETVVQRIADGYVGWQESSFPGLLGNVVAGRIANRFDLGGTNCVVDAACASSLSALHLAALELTAGRADVVLTGGVDTFNDVFMYMCFSKTPALSPTGDVRPFDAAADGTVLGEGVGMVVLKRLDRAREDGDRIYAVLRGIGTASDGRGNAVYAPKAAGQVECLRDAYRVAGVGPDTVELVEAHGTGTKVGDATEAAALVEVYRGSGRNGTWCALGSVKSQIGHTKAAAGVAGLIKVAAALHHKVLPPTIKVQQPLDALQPGRSPFYVNTAARPWVQTDHPRRAAVSAFGFGGSNFHCVLEEAAARKDQVDWDGRVQIIALAGRDGAALRSQLSALPSAEDWEAVRHFAAGSRRDWSASAPWRMVLVVERGRTEIARQRQQALDLLEQPARKPGPPMEGVFFSCGATLGKVAVVFPGQGAQYVGMLRDLACRFPHFQDALAEGDRIWRESSPDTRDRLSDRTYPFGAFTADERAAQEAALRDTATAQPALAAVCLGAWRILESFGTRADFAAGHSFGELLALCVDGRLTAEELFRLALLRGRLMADAGGDGGMLAVAASTLEVEALLHQERLDLVIANHNTPQQVVLAGRVAEIDRAEALWTARRTSVRRLAVGSAFHSPLVAPAAGPLRAALEDMALPAGALPVFANTTATAYPASAAEARALLAEQLARPVRWVDEVENLWAAGARTFLEVGPGRRVSGMIDAILHDREHACVALDTSSGQRSGMFDLACCLAELAVRGHPNDLRGWDDTPTTAPPVDGMRSLVVSLCGANYVKPKGAQAPKPRSCEGQPTKNGTPQATMNGPPAPDPVPPRREAPAAAPPPPNPAVTPPVPAAASSAVVQALQVTRESLASLQRMQEQTASLHRQFLEGQEAAHRTVQLLVEQQQRLLQAALDGAPLPAPTPLPPAVRIPVPPPLPISEPPAPPAPRAEVFPIPAPSERNSQKTEAVLLEVVSEKTGYPADMLDLGMTLDTDLGIDSIKRVEILSALQERLPDAPIVRPEHLGTLHTLRHVAEFLAGAPSNGTAHSEEHARVAPPVAVSTPGNTQQAAVTVAQVLVEVVSEKTGYPADMLDLGMALDTDLGIDSIKRVEILSALQERLPDAPVVRPEHLGTLHTLRHVADFLAGHPGTNGTAKPVPPTSLAPAPPVAAAIRSGLRRLALEVIDLDEAKPRSAIRLPRDSEVWIATETEAEAPLASAIGQRLAAMGLRPVVATCSALGMRRPQVSLAGLVLLASLVATDDSFLRDGLQVLKLMAEALRAAAREGGAVVLTIARIDGAFGLVSPGTSRLPLDGGLAGLAKTAAREWPQVAVKALDLAPDFGSVEEEADAIVREMFLAGPVEVGLSSAGARALHLLEGPAPAPAGSPPFSRGDVIVLSGGGRGVTAEAAVALARRFAATLVLLGRSPAPQEEPAWLTSLASEAEIKRELARQASGASLKEIGDLCREVLAAREVRQTLRRIEAAGGRAMYRSVDVRDAAAVVDVLAGVRRELGPIRGLVHGAGVLADARIVDKTPEQFDCVYETKVAGLRNLLACLGADELRGLVLFSSSTARFGRVGQVDYAISNEVLNKLAQREARLHPGCRVLSLNWGPWDGGMVTSGLKKIFQDENIGLIPPEAGSRFLVEELESGSLDVEVVVLAPAPASPATHAAHGEEMAADRQLPLAFERVLDRADHPVLESHQLDGRPVVPVALLLEWLAHAALHHNPGLIFHGCQNLRIFHGIILGSDGSLTVRFGAGKAQRRDGLQAAAVEVRSRRPDGRVVLHARADILLATALPAAPPAEAAPTVPPCSRSVAAVYRDLLFHGPALHGLRSIDGIGPAAAVAHAVAAPAPQDWIARPLRHKWLADPLILDTSFQLLVVWTLEQRGAANLPCAIHDYRQYRRAFPAEGARIVAHVRRVTEGGAVADIDYCDTAGAVIARVHGYECVIDPGLERAFGHKAPTSGARG